MLLLSKSSSRKVVALLAAQAIIGIVVSLLLALASIQWMLSSLLGVLTVLLGNFYMALRTFWRATPPKGPQGIVIGMYRGIFGKYVILAVMIIVLCRVLTLVWWAFLIGMAVVQLGNWLAPLWFNVKQKGKT